MDRRKTILIAVLVNASLLVLLFVLALHQEETPVRPLDSQQLSQERGPLFPEFQDLQTEPPVPLAFLDEPAPQHGEAPPLHQLPPLAVVAPVPELPPTSPAAILPAIKTLAEVTVKKGDTLEKIARLNQTSVDEIIRLNQLSSSFLRIGQVLKLPAEKSVAAAQKPLPIDKRPLENTQQEYYTVKVGDNPWTIAMKHHLKVEELLKINNLNEEKARRLKPGDRLRIR